ncbi:filamentous hemagglutinin family N-terminal domain protein [Rivularia sp. PCC 7116]|uniref:two-partner secretion domain-containing protein n=1 Tax=Rivularia sp. PCC 7116 TaxID=373994 RepID=UPI00029EFA03|nr:filamentous hemagglutinin N-terminal domain-containing protein [Rivularia sp. PCC 7116]AFY54831.1 filamentous hemagglutinin family N-terminal domain protein [Rivularia sp. PCC 7116]
MKGIAFLSGFITVFLTSGINLPAVAQVTSDNTTNTTVNTNGNNFNIINGIQKGNNLFHSFKEFSIPNGGSATFNNSTDVTNIINRVTGGNVSNIDGLIKASGNANLFLINPSGIVFGENAKLDIGGSFLGSTASSILFEDGFEFSAVNPQEKPLLTVSVPVGLQMGTNPGAIEVNGSGHNLTARDANFAPYINPLSFIPSQLKPGLQVKPGNTLALLGGDIQLVGGILTAVEARVELASLKQGRVSLVDTSKGFSLNNSKISDFGNIQLLSRALVDVSGAGEISVQGNQFNIKDGSVVGIQNRGIQTAGNINVNAKSIDISGAISETQIRSSLVNETFAGDAGNINISTERLSIEDGAGVFSRTFGFGNSGVININATESIDVIGVSSDPRNFSIISSVTFGQEDSGNINLSTGNLSVLNSGVISTTTFGNGSAGNINVQSDNTLVFGLSRGFFGNTTITATSFGKGNSGNISINTQTLSVKDGGNVNTSGYSSGNSGNVTVNATEFLEISGGKQMRGSNINSAVLSLPEFYRQLLTQPHATTGNAGNVTINTPRLKISDDSSILVRNAGTGNAGKLAITADLIQLENQGELVARSNSGRGGDIFVQSDSLQMRRSGLITTDAKGEGNGGNITINTNTLVALENSDITANAQNSFGGKVTVNAYGIFGTQFRENLTEESDITASSDLGAEFSGDVELNTPGIDPSSVTVELPENLTDSSNQIASGCAAQTGNTFIVTGRGGIPTNPNLYSYSNPIWLDIRDLSAFRKPNNNSEITNISNKPAIIEATSFIRNQDGEIELIASQNEPLTTQGFNCSGMNTL